MRGATFLWRLRNSCIYYFNSRSRAGSDQSFFISKIDCFLFQFTLPCGERPRSSCHFSHLLIISIHAPVRGATKQRPTIDKLIDISIHAPVRGATIFFTILCTSFKISIHAPVRGATIPDKRLMHKLPFQFTLPCGERQETCKTAYG